MRYTAIEYERIDHIRIIRFNRPERRNCIDLRTHHELVDAWTRFKEDEDAYVAVLTGAGSKAFCAGGDLKSDELHEYLRANAARHEAGEMPGALGPSRWTDIYKPIIAAVNGAAYAGGLEWACFADIRIADEHASFGVTCRRWNIGLADGGTQRLPRIVGMGRAMELIITGRVIDAREALAIGLVNEVVPSGTCVDRALELAHFICELPQPAIRTDKEAAVRGYGRPLEEGLLIEARAFNKSIFDPATIEGLRRFRERDHPDRRPGEDPATPGLVRD
ncbi:MAG: enoyl-CoA hydratase [Deltaproteobacteria bacterium]|nr:MAG: enoyl-CoA hydratase [Deltaproteobacteria bacterium]